MRFNDMVTVELAIIRQYKANVKHAPVNIG